MIPKLHFVDPGLACYLLDIESPLQLERDKMRGAIFENTAGEIGLINYRHLPEIL